MHEGRKRASGETAANAIKAEENVKFFVSRETCSEGCMLLFFPSDRQSIYCSFSHVFWLILLPHFLLCIRNYSANAYGFTLL